MSPCSSNVAVTDDLDAFRAVLRPRDSDITRTGRGHFAATHARVDLHRLWMQGADESLPRIWETSLSQRRHSFVFLAQPDHAMILSGTEIGSDDLGLYNASETTVCQRLLGPTRWGSLSLSAEDWQNIGSAALGNELVRATNRPKVTPARDALDKLRRLHASAIFLAEHAPELLANPDATRGLESELIEAVVGCFSAPQPPERSLAWRHHSAIMARFRGVLEQYFDKPLYLPDLCAAAGVADRTLRLCCEESFGMGPKRYLLLRRLHLARRALRTANAATETVTSIATQFGFWELGRFAVEYRNLFGESPSTTLGRAAQ